MSTLATVKALNDAIMLANALAPLVQQAMESGTEVTADDLKAASLSLGQKIDALDALIAQVES